MTKMYDLNGMHLLALGNGYSYTVTAADHAKYSSFFVLEDDNISLSDGTNTMRLHLAANEEVPLNSTITTISGVLANTIVFQF